MTTEEVRRRRMDRVIRGHIPKAGTRDIGGVLHGNDGDRAESCTALVEHGDRRVEILHWADRRAWSMIDGARRVDDARRSVAEPPIA